MQPFIDSLVGLRKLLFRIIEVITSIIVLIVLVYVLLGEGSSSYVDEVVANLAYLVERITPQALVAIAIVVSVSLILRSRQKRDD
jgi:hypothetical protein